MNVGGCSDLVISESRMKLVTLLIIMHCSFELKLEKYDGIFSILEIYTLRNSRVFQSQISSVAFYKDDKNLFHAIAIIKYLPV